MAELFNILLRRCVNAKIALTRAMESPTLGVQFPMKWKEYQERTAEFFQRLGCNAEVEAKVAGARAEHRIDVWVRFVRFGLETKWVIECKHWKSPVPKEKILALRSIVEDVGADRGILVSDAGFQAGAIRAAQNTNITLTDLTELRETTEEDLVISVVHRLETRAVELRYALMELYVSEDKGKLGRLYTPRPGVDGEVVMCTVGKLAFLRDAFDRIRLRDPPYAIPLDDGSEERVRVDTAEEVIDKAKRFLEYAEMVLERERAQQI